MRAEAVATGVPYGGAWQPLYMRRAVCPALSGHVGAGRGLWLGETLSEGSDVCGCACELLLRRLETTKTSEGWLLAGRLAGQVMGKVAALQPLTGSGRGRGCPGLLLA